MYIRKGYDYPGCDSDLQVFVVDQGPEGLGPVKQSTVEEACRPRLRQNPEDLDRVHLETHQIIQGS